MKNLLTKMSVAACMLFSLLGCTKEKVTASYVFVRDTENATKATLVDGFQIVWEDGDEVRLNVELYREDAWRPAKEIEAKLVYNSGEWDIYTFNGDGPVQVNALTVSMGSDKYKVVFDFDYNKNLELSCRWHRTLDFKSGMQRIPVKEVLEVPLDQI